MLRTNEISLLNHERDPDLFETVTEEEIIFLWRSIKGRGLSEDEALKAGMDEKSAEFVERGAEVYSKA